MTGIQLLTQNNRLALLFPWRISVVLVPLSTSLIAAALARWLASWLQGKPAGRQRLFLSASYLAIVLAVLVGAVRFGWDLQRKGSAPERRMEEFVAAHKRPGDVYLTPVKFQDFRLATGAPVYVDFKSIPYRDADVIEWDRRYQVADVFYKSPGCESLLSLTGHESITHVVLPTSELALTCPGLKEIYADESYWIYALRR
jgi:hypothetical protein